jgi:hypothetical protein
MVTGDISSGGMDPNAETKPEKCLRNHMTGCAGRPRG